MFPKTEGEDGVIGHESFDEQNPKREREKDVTLNLHHVSQCCEDEPNEFGDGFRREGYEKMAFGFGHWRHRDNDLAVR